MKRKYLLFLLPVLFLFSCENRVQKIEWDSNEYVPAQNTLADDQMNIAYPVANGKSLADSVNHHVVRTLTTLIGYPGGDVSASVDSLLAERFDNEYTSHIPYSVNTDWQTDQFGKVLSVRLSTYIFSGGAHGLSMETYLNFDMRNGRLLGLSDMISDTATLVGLNREAFLESHSDLSGMLFIPVDELPLPENFFIDESGFNAYYNSYEIGPYSIGGNGYVIPLEIVARTLNPEYFPQE